jgi:hypothetical protein
VVVVQAEGTPTDLLADVQTLLAGVVGLVVPEASAHGMHELLLVATSEAAVALRLLIGHLLLCLGFRTRGANYIGEGTYLA